LTHPCRLRKLLSEPEPAKKRDFERSRRLSHSLETAVSYIIYITRAIERDFGPSKCGRSAEKSVSAK
jgi:hypothetical protein